MTSASTPAFLVALVPLLLHFHDSHCAALEHVSFCETKTNYFSGQVADSGYPWYLALQLPLLTSVLLASP